jgi:hypothetical protein
MPKVKGATEGGAQNKVMMACNGAHARVLPMNRLRVALKIRFHGGLCLH